MKNSGKGFNTLSIKATFSNNIRKELYDKALSSKPITQYYFDCDAREWKRKIVLTQEQKLEIFDKIFEEYKKMDFLLKNYKTKNKRRNKTIRLREQKESLKK